MEILENHGKYSCGGNGDLDERTVKPPACPIARTDSTGEIIATVLLQAL
jgi:hypothetical protein